MRPHTLLFLLLGLCCAPLAQSADEVLYVRAQAAIPLLSGPAAEAVVLRRLAPGDRLTVVSRQPGFVEVAMPDGASGWMRETDVTAVAPPAVRVSSLETEVDQLRRELATAQANLRNAQGELQQARAAANSARTAGAGEIDVLRAERDRLQQALDARNLEFTQLTARVAELEMAQQAARLLAERKTAAPADRLHLPAMQWALAVLAAFALVLLGAWYGRANARRRLRQRYHGLEL